MLDTQRTFSALSEEYVECLMRDHPVLATEVGIHDYDRRLPADTPEGFRERAAWLRGLEQRLLASVPWNELPIEQRVDYALLRSGIAGLRADFEEIRVQARNPVLYPETAVRGIHALIARPFAPLEERKEAILERMMAVPEYLQKARANLEQVPEIFAALAGEVSGSGVTFMEEVTQQLIRAFPGEAERIEHAGSMARRGFAQFQEFVRGELGPRIGGPIGIGERWMNYKLEREHLVAMDCTAVEAFGRDQTERARTMLVEEARRIDPARSWMELIGEARRRHPEPLTLLDAYTAEAERARRFVEHKRLVPIPDSRIEIVETPLFHRPTTPYTWYGPAAPFDADHVGSFFVTPVDLERDPAEREALLAAHNEIAITLAVVHEAWPGHHLQRCHALGAGSRLRKIADSPMFSEGWALYCEELMWQEGFFKDPLTRLYQLRNQLWRACRVRIDVGLHTGRMGLEEAADLLVREALLEPVYAEREVRRYALSPTQPLSYLVGRGLLMELREEARRRLGSRFNLHDFHAALLAGGTLPPSLVREEIWGRLAA